MKVFNFAVLKRIILILFVFILPLLSIAEEVKFSMTLSATRVSTQDYLQVQYLIENSRKISQFVPPVFRNFTVVEGPDQTSGWNMENGALKEYVSFSFLLKPIKVGKMLIPGATAKIDGKVYKTRGMEVEVTGAVIPGFTEDQAMMNDLILKPGETVEQKIRNNIFVKLEVDRRSCFVGEPVVASYKLYTRLRSESRVSKRPSFNGFSVYDMANPETGESTTEMIQGRDYNVYLLRKVQLYPLQSGDLELETLEVENDISFIKSNALSMGVNSILRDLADKTNSSGALVRETVSVHSDPVHILVKPLPEDSGALFSGAVGKFSVKTFVEDAIVHKNDVVNLHVQVSGSGNFPMFTSPQIKWPDSADAFEGTTSENYNKFVAPVSGSKLFSIPFTPRKEGEMVIPAVAFRYFDPVKGDFITTTSDSIVVKVMPQQKRADLQKQLELTRVEKPANAWKWILSAFGLIVVFGGLYILLKRAESHKPVPSNTDEARVDVLQKNDPLEKIRHAFDTGDTKAFYHQLVIVIDDCLMKKYQADGRLNWEQVLAQKGVDRQLIDDIAALKEDAELAMYTPFVMEAKMVEDLSRIEKIVC